MSSEGRIYFERGIRYFELEQYDRSVQDFIQAYNLDYEKEMILENLYQCFVYPNEQEFRDNFNKNSGEFTQLDYEACELDFIPVSEEKFYIFDREEQKFKGLFILDYKPVQGIEIEFNSILYTDIWDIREIVPDMCKCNRNTIYIVLNELEAKFVSFFKLPNFKQIYCDKFVVFKNDLYMRTFFEEYEEFYLPKLIHSAHTQKYLDMIKKLHQNRICPERSVKQERKNIFLSICLPSYNCGTKALRKVEYLLKCPYDSEIEFIISNNASTAEMDGYEKIRKIKDARIRYYEYTEYQEKNMNVLKTLELAQGTFAVLVDDENCINLEHLSEYLNFLQSYEECGVLIASGSYKDMKNLYSAGISAVDMCSNINDMNGMAFNMGLCAAKNIYDILYKKQKNVFVKDYVHICIAMLLAKTSDLVIEDLDLIINIPNKCDLDQNTIEANKSLSYIYPESRIAQQTGFLDFCDEYLDFGKSIFIEMFLKRCDQTYFLIRIAYDMIAGFDQFGEKQEVYYQIYQEQKKYLSIFPHELSSEEYKKINGQLKKIANSNLQQGSSWLARLYTNELKHQIFKVIKDREKIEKLEQLIVNYEKEYPQDLDLYIMKAWHKYRTGDTEKAYFILREGIYKNPFIFNANLFARLLCKKTKRFAEAFRYETILKLLKQYYTELPEIDEWKEDLLIEMNETIREFQEKGNMEQVAECLKDIDYIEKHLEKGFGFDDHAYYKSVLKRSVSNRITIGATYEDVFGNKKYNASYDTNNAGDIIIGMRSTFNNYLLTKLECLEVEKMNQMQLGNEGDYLLPVLQEDNSKSYTIILPDNREFECRNLKAQHFEYYRLPSATRLLSEEPLCIGNPIILKQDPGKKKLVLNIFIDGISQKVIGEENFAELMPFTSKFFSQGVCCSNVYTAAEWTLPSLAAYVSGMSSVNHMIIHNHMTNVFSTDYTILAEYFKEQGYYTAKIDGDWRSTQSYGYGRGMDRIIYQHQYIGMNVEQVVQNVLEHIKLMKETNQFIWMCAGDLHMIADEIPLKQSVQASVPLEYRTVDKSGVSSVKQEYSRSKRELYIRQMKYIDEYLEILYHYIEENYSNDEIIVSLFGDHGQGFLVEEGKHFLSEGRSKVAMMFRGGETKNTMCDELLSTCDYLPIMCKLAGIPLKSEKIDGNLPVFFGGDKKRKYAITESIHPGDPYQASVVSEDFVYYFTSEGIVEYDGRFELGEYECWLYDREGNECIDKVRKEEYFQVLLEHIGNLVIY